MTQIMTGHGNFQSYLYNLNIVTTPQCGCRSGVDNAEHLIFFCKKYDLQRSELKSLAVKMYKVWPISPNLIIANCALWSKLEKFIMKSKKLDLN